MPSANKSRLSEGLPPSPRKKTVQETLQEPRINGRIQRLRPRKRNKDNDLNMATWNLRSLFTRGALHSTLEDLTNYKIQIAAVQETRWHSYHESPLLLFQRQFKKQTRIWSRFHSRQIHRSCAYKQVHVYLRLNTKKFKVTILNIHAPNRNERR